MVARLYGGRATRPFRVRPSLDEAWPYRYNQLAGDTHNTAQGRFNDCLPTSCCAVIDYLTGDAPFPDDIRDWCYGASYAGYTFPADMAQYLSVMWGIPSEVVAIDAPQDVISEALGKGWPVLARTWEAAGGYFHWTPLTLFTASQVVRHQVLGGFREVLDRAEWLRRYAGYLLVVKQARDA